MSPSSRLPNHSWSPSSRLQNHSPSSPPSSSKQSYAAVLKQPFVSKPAVAAVLKQSYAAVLKQSLESKPAAGVHESNESKPAAVQPVLSANVKRLIRCMNSFSNHGGPGKRFTYEENKCLALAMERNGFNDHVRNTEALNAMNPDITNRRKIRERVSNLKKKHPWIKDAFGEKKDTSKGKHQKWTPQEIFRLEEAIDMYGCAWNELSNHVGTKNPIQCESRYYDCLKRNLCACGCGRGLSYIMKNFLSTECAVLQMKILTDSDGRTTFLDPIDGKRKVLSFDTRRVPVKFRLPNHLIGTKAGSLMVEETSLALAKFNKERTEKKSRKNEAEMTARVINCEQKESDGKLVLATEDNLKAQYRDAKNLGKTLFAQRKVVNVCKFTLCADGTIQDCEEIGWATQKSRSGAVLLKKGKDGKGTNFSVFDFRTTDAMVKTTLHLMTNARGTRAARLIENTMIDGIKSEMPFGLILNQGKYGAYSGYDNTIQGAAAVSVDNFDELIRSGKIGYNVRHKEKIEPNIPDEWKVWLEM
ncbi:hypothetical protein ACHAWF_006975 [Thalassiosira exigua]